MRGLRCVDTAGAVRSIRATCAACLILPAAAQAATGTDSAGESLQEVVVTGSLIPLPVTQENANPVSVITAHDLQTRGFASVADAVQRSSFATGAVQGPQNTAGFTQGALTVSMFGLSPSYTKILIDGRPIADYPALYNGTDIITDISTIPTLLVDHIDILPGGQSSIYGSDAIAGVVNITLRKKQDGAEADARVGWTADGGGMQKRLGVSDGFGRGPLSVLVGAEYEKIDPIWGFQRSKTRQIFAGGTSPQTAARDWLVIGTFGDPKTGDLYYFKDPANCANLTGQFGGTVTKQFRGGGRGYYCGSTASGDYSLNNGTESTQGFAHATWDLGGGTQLFGDVLASHAVTRFSSGPVVYLSANDNSRFSNYYDASVGDFLNLQRFFSPEEAGNYRSQMDKNTNNAVRATFGLSGEVGSDWKYTLDMTYTQNKLTEAQFLAFTSKIEAFFAPIYGPNLGPDPIFGSQPTYAPDYAQFYKPLTPAQYASFTGYASNYSRTEDSVARAQITNSALFTLPGGDAGVAAVVEGGRQSWKYQPDPVYQNGEAYLFFATPGDGHRTRSAGTVELRLPVLRGVTVDLSSRYDDYKVAGGSVDKFTYNFGVEYRPAKALLLRGRYGSAFKAPTLSDEFQGHSGYVVGATDYYHCALTGYTPGGTPPHDIASCPQAGPQVTGGTQGNPALKPINAKVTNVGLVWSPLERSAFSVDYLTWDIKDEVATVDSDLLLRTESACRLGQLDPNSPSCQQAISEVTRDPATGLIVSIFTPKLNLARETLHVLALSGKYTVHAGAAGDVSFDAAYTDILKHTFVRFPGDPQIDLLTNPFYGIDFKTRANFSVSWEIGRFDTTVYLERYGKTPNNAAQQGVEGYALPHAGDVAPWTIVNASLQYQALPGLTFTGNVNNLFNRSPPYDGTFTGNDAQPYNTFDYNDYGRTYFLGVNYKVKK